MSGFADQNPVVVVPITPPPPGERVQRNADFAGADERRTRYSLPSSLESTSPVGYRRRFALTSDEAALAMSLLSLVPPTKFRTPEEVPENELFEEASLGILSSRQSTNFRGHKQVTFGPHDSKEVMALLRRMELAPGAGQRGQLVLAGAAYTHVVFSRPYRTPFTTLLGFVGHRRFQSLGSVPLRLLRKGLLGHVDIPTIGYLRDVHLGIFADTIERAVVIASQGRRKAAVLVDPFVGRGRSHNVRLIRDLEDLCGITGVDRREGWEASLVVQVGFVDPEEAVTLPADLWRRLGAEVLALRSERIQPGVDQDEKAPLAYRSRQDMDVSDALVRQAGRAAYNAFARWSGLDREQAKQLLILDRIDVLTPGGKERLRSVRKRLDDITDRVVREIPKWIDWPLGRTLSKNAERGRKAFALAGQRIYVCGLSNREVVSTGIDWDLAVRAAGAAACRGALYAELMGVVDLPNDCDLLAGICMMAGPVNQDDIGKTYFGMGDLLDFNFAHREPTSLLVWTLKAKTIADPIGNEEQLLNPAQKGALVELRPGPDEVVLLKGTRSGDVPLRATGNTERAFGDADNFVTSPDGREIPGNRGEPFPKQPSPWAL